MRVLTSVALLLVAGCSQQAGKNEATANVAASNTPADAAKPEVPALDGEWQLNKIDGRPVDAGSSTVASFGGGKLSITAGCSRRAWTFTQKRNIVAFTADPRGSSNCQSPPNVDQEAAIHALDRATMAIFGNEGREANLSGDGGNVTLVRR